MTLRMRMIKYCKDCKYVGFFDRYFYPSDYWKCKASHTEGGFVDTVTGDRRPTKSTFCQHVNKGDCKAFKSRLDK